ncbi:MAG: prolipoprotein diacylglyceryl transferase [Mycoplasmataceae bacterium]|nr:prolipoprotein diacylglyceryl transferase [Mycoplasmataceae bacterium]
MNNSYVQGVPINSFIPLYPLTIMIGMLLAILTVAYFWRKEKYPIELLLKIIIITIPSSIIGARIFFIFERLIYNPTDPFPDSAWYAIWNGGLSIQGGVIFPTVLNLMFIRKHRDIIDIRKAFGIILPTVLIGQAVGRWGNFANHEVYGRVVEQWEISWLGPIITSHMNISAAAGESPLFRAPLFLYESVASLVGYVLIVWVVLNFGWTKPGTPGALYLIWYGVTRVSMEHLREESYFFYTALSIVSIVLGLLLMIYFYKNSFKLYNVEVNGWTKNYILKTQQKVMLVAVGTKWINE